MRYAVLTLVLLSCGCLMGGGKATSKPSTGQELTDLKSALDKGAIDPAEYETMRQAIVARETSVH